MDRTQPRRALAICLGVILAAMCQLARAQDFGDTPYVQTPMNVVQAMLKSAKVSAKDFVIDLGSGDGRMIITAAKQYGARGFGVDHDARLVRLANANAAKEGVADRAVFYARDLYKTDIHRATVMTIYLLPEVNLMARPKLLRELRPGTRIVSHDYDMGEWKPDEQYSMDAPDKPVGRDQVSKVFFWVVPANVTGDWVASVKMGAKPQDYLLKFTQKFQFAEGVVESGGARAVMEEVQLSGARVSFRAKLPGPAGQPVAHEFSGRVLGEAIEGTVKVEGIGRPNGFPARRIAGKTVIGPEVDPKLAELRAGSGMQ